MTAPYWSNGVATLYQADARAIPLPDGSVHCCVTSPPYWGLRDYGLSAWYGGDPECSHLRLAKDRQKAHGLTDRFPETAAYGGDAVEPWPAGVCGHCGATQQAAGIGLEPTLSDWLANIVAVSREVWRVLRDDGTYWLNLGDAYAGGGRRQEGDTPESVGGLSGKSKGIFGARPQPMSAHGLPAKNLMGQPWRAAFALQDDGWILRSAIVWHKCLSGGAWLIRENAERRRPSHGQGFGALGSGNGAALEWRPMDASGVVGTGRTAQSRCGNHPPVRRTYRGYP